MFYIAHLTGSYNRTGAQVEEFATEKEAVEFADKLARTKLIGIFKGERLEPVISEQKVTRKGITGFQKSEKEN